MKHGIRKLGLMVFAAHISLFAGAVSADAFDAVNSVRQAAGLSPLSPSPELQQAAQAHAEYLAQYLPQGGIATVSAHQQRRSLPGFSGAQAPDRAAYFGYPHRLVTENISVGNRSLEESVSSLMSAIYHRLAFLDPHIDQMGFAEVERRYVYNMGQARLAQACRTRAPEARLDPPHNCLGKRMKASAFAQVCGQLPESALYSPPFATRCSNGALLQDGFMQQVCASPPAGAVLRDAGRYYDACGNGLKLSADWFDRICASSDPNIIYTHSGSYYEICSPAQQVHADWYESLCDKLPPEALDTDSGRYYQVCNNDFLVKSEFLQATQSEVLNKLPDAVLWPADGSMEIQPVFYNEEPHPTPDLPMTGYPISIQFNPETVERVSIMGFTLEVEQQEADSTKVWRAVEPIRQIDYLSDLNGQLTSHQFAWFPLRRLEWGAHYRYHVDALVDGVFHQYQAEFRTTELALPVYRVGPGKQAVDVGENHFALYRPPDAYDDTPFSQVGLRSRGRSDVEVSVIDTNTVELKVRNPGCAPIILSTRLEERLTINFCRPAYSGRSNF